MVVVFAGSFSLILFAGSLFATMGQGWLDQVQNRFRRKGFEDPSRNNMGQYPRALGVRSSASLSIFGK